MKDQIKKEKQNMKENSSNSLAFKSNTELQDQYADTLKGQHREGFPLINTRQYLESIRDSGYKNTGTAINEFVDNSIEAEASQVLIKYVADGNDITDIFIIDNGHGMSRDMLMSAVMWGGTHRHLKSDFGKYGFGHPNAVLFLTAEYETYSKRKDSDWYALNISIEQLKTDPLFIDPRTGVIFVP